MYLLGIDLETTGVDPEKDQIIEIGAILWDTDLSQPIEMFSKLIQNSGLALPQMVKELTGITDNQIEKFGSPLKSVIDELHELSKKCEFLVGHNAIFFDSKFLDRACTELGLRCLGPNWIDTLIDVNFPTHMRTRKLSHLAAEHKISLFNHHRAVFDVLTMFQILSRYDIQEIADRASSELVQVVAKVSIENKNQASELGFRWNPKDKIWSKLMRQFDIEKAKFPFSVQVVKHEF